MPKEIERSIISEIQADRKAGRTIKEICDRHDVSDFTVKKYCKGIKPPPKKRSTTITPKRKAEQTASRVISQEMSKIAEEETRKRLEAGKITVTELGRVAELYGMEPAEYVRWLQDQALAHKKPHDYRAELKDFGLSCIYARALGVNINPGLIPLMYIIARLEEEEQRGKQ